MPQHQRKEEEGLEQVADRKSIIICDVSLEFTSEPIRDDGQKLKVCSAPFLPCSLFVFANGLY